jgi:hypothetical protein
VLSGARSIQDRDDVSRLDEGHHTAYDVIELLFTIIFTCEMCSKLLAHGWEGRALESPNAPLPSQHPLPGDVALAVLSGT